MKSLAQRTDDLKQSGIRAISKLVREVDGINLGQGICDMPVPDPVKEATHRAIDEDKSIYSHYAGIKLLRDGVVEKARDYNRIPVPSSENVVVSAGSTGVFVTAVMALLNPGDEIVMFEPFYGYHRHIVDLIGAKSTFVPLDLTDLSVDFGQIRDSISDNTKAILITTPANPSGKVWSEAECLEILALAHEHDLYVITDEIYEYMVYDNHRHVSMASLPTAFDRVVTLSGFSKTFNMTGWRLGYAIAPDHIAEKMGLINDLLYICAPTPLQHGVAAAFEMDHKYYDDLLDSYSLKRSMLSEALTECGFDIVEPQGSYYILADFRPLASRYPGFGDDMEACKTLISRCRIGTVPGRSFFEDPRDGAHLLRFCYAKEVDVLAEACTLLREAFTQPVL